MPSACWGCRGSLGDAPRLGDRPMSAPSLLMPPAVGCFLWGQPVLGPPTSGPCVVPPPLQCTCSSGAPAWGTERGTWAQAGRGVSSSCPRHQEGGRSSPHPMPAWPVGHCGRRWCCLHWEPAWGMEAGSDGQEGSQSEARTWGPRLRSGLWAPKLLWASQFSSRPTTQCRPQSPESPVRWPAGPRWLTLALC